MNTALMKQCHDLICTEAMKSDAGFIIKDIKEDDILVDDKYTLSFLVTLRAKPFESDDGMVYPAWAALQIGYNRDDNEFYMIVGEDTELAITYGNIMTHLYFSEIQCVDIGSILASAGWEMKSCTDGKMQYLNEHYSMIILTNDHVSILARMNNLIQIFNNKTHFHDALRKADELHAKSTYGEKLVA